MDPSPPARRRLLEIYGWLAAIAAALLLVYFAGRVVPYLKSYPYDGKLDWIGARAFWEHVNPYSDEQLQRVKLDSLGHPPTTSFWMLPFGAMELHDAGNALAVLVLTMLLVQLLVIAIELRLPAPLAT